MAVTLYGLILLINYYTCITSASVIDTLQPATNLAIMVETKHVLEKDTLLLVCNTTALPDIDDFYWIRNDTSGGHSTLYSTEWKLEFISIVRTDSAVYSCHGIYNSSNENVTLVAFKVDVQYATEVTNVMFYPQVITENETFAVTCNVHGNPEPVWSIFNQDTGWGVMSATLSGDVILTAVHVVCGQSGKWVCTGSNQLNNGVNATERYHITVQCPPRLDPCYTPPCDVFSATIGSNVTMEVNITADPMPSYVWSRGDNKTMDHVIIEKHSRGTTLTILDIDIDDFGNYSVKMVNPFGTREVPMVLKGTGAPQKPFDLGVSNITFDSVELTWTSGYDMGTPQRFYIVKWVGNVFIQTSSVIDEPYTNDGIGQSWSYRISGLDGGEEYKLAVVAQNYDNTTMSQPITFNTTAAPNHHEAIEGKYVVLYTVGALLCCVGVGSIFWIIYRKTGWPLKRDKFHKIANPVSVPDYTGSKYYSINNEFKETGVL